jgi:hypothetical protein
MTELYTYPRLPRAHALRLIEELADVDAEGARSRASSTHPAAAPIATGAPHVPQPIIEGVAARVREIAESFSYPAQLARGSVAMFDQPCGEVLLDAMRIVPADAASEEVWSFLSLVVLPDVVVWRFPDRLTERLIGQPRNAFRRLWWRAFTLEGANASNPQGPAPLGEDELVNIFERPSVARCAALARAMTRAVRSLPAGYRTPRSTLMREVAKRVRRIVSFVSVDVLTTDELDGLVEAEMVAALAALEASPAQ